MRLSGLALALLLAGCDPTYLVHLHARADPGAWVVPLEQAERAARAGPDGRAELVHGGFLRNTRWSPVLVWAAGRRPWVLAPERDFALRARGWLYVTEWDADLATQLAPAVGAGLPLLCDAAGCQTVVASAEPERCEQGWLVVIERERVRGYEVQPCRPVGAGGWRCALPPPEGPGEAVLVVACGRPEQAPTHFVVTDPAPLRAQ